MNLTTILILTFAFALLIWAVIAFNRLVHSRNQMRAAWADIDVQLTRRHDLVPQLVAAVKGYAVHEQSLLQSVTQLRAQALTQTRRDQLGQTEAELEQALNHLLMLHETYPELKASENFIGLQRDLVAVEDHLQYARRFYNGSVRDNNDAVQRIPDKLVARAFGFALGEFYQAEAEARPSVPVQLTP